MEFCKFKFDDRKDNNRDNQTGTQGPPGPQGTTGAIGPQGIQGIQGERGFNGTNGVNGTQGPPGPSGITFLNGTNLYITTGDFDFLAPFSSTASCIIAGDPTTLNNVVVSGGFLKDGSINGVVSIQGEQSFPVSDLSGWNAIAPVGGVGPGTASLAAQAICFDNPDP